ncbi:Putative cyclin-dependent kinase F-2 [Triticum urartu]|uniref:[RNA-polymerase]-subunit kinase n=1 Tax=Triticum urartu TaxID=4572 RepID=M7ZW21_TRIUA|nr:Putative cyclin-dependent kinase F-2 [Triticum urartu]
MVYVECLVHEDDEIGRLLVGAKMIVAPANRLKSAGAAIFRRLNPKHVLLGITHRSRAYGTARLAPELLLASTEYNARVGTWALGCIMAELLAGAPLLPGRSEMDQLNRVFDTVGTDDMTGWPGFCRLAALPAQQAAQPALGDVP